MRYVFFFLHLFLIVLIIVLAQRSHYKFQGGFFMLKNYLRFLQYAKGYHLWLMIFIVGGLVRFLLPLTTPLFQKYVIDEVINSKIPITSKEELLLWLAGISIGVYLVLRKKLETLRFRASFKIHSVMSKRIKQQAFSKLYELDKSFYSERTSGSIVSVFQDITKTKDILGSILITIWIDTTGLLFVLVALIQMYAKMAWLPMLFVGFLFWVQISAARRSHTLTHSISEQTAETNGFILERVQGVETAKSFRMKKIDEANFAKHLEVSESLSETHASLLGNSTAWINTLADFGPQVILLIGGYLVLQGDMTLGTLVAFVAYMQQLKQPVQRLVDVFPKLTTSSVALERIFAFLDTTSHIKEKDQSIELKSVSNSILFENVFFGYKKDEHILKDFSLHLEAGKHYGLVGTSGSGKSTLLQLLTRSYDVQEGRLLLDGLDIREVSLDSLRSNIGIVSQEPTLFKGTIRDNIRMGKWDATEEEILAASYRAHCHEFIRSLPDGYNTVIGEKGNTLSGGQRQRISLARVFLKNPPLIILDEATSALDNETERYIQRSVEEFTRGKTVITVAHRLTTVQNADCIFVMSEGTVVEEGTHKELLLQHGVYHELCAAQ